MSKKKELKEAVKFDEGKLRFDLIPPGPLQELARVYTVGMRKYNARNWESGMEWGRFFAALQRHTWAWWGGEDLDPEDGVHHLAHAAFCCLALLEYVKTHPELDDRSLPKK